MVVSMLNKLYKYYLVGTLTNKELEVLESYISDTSTEDSLKNMLDFYFSDVLNIMEDPKIYYNTEISNNEEDEDEDEILVRIRDIDNTFIEKRDKLIDILENLENRFYERNNDLYNETKLIFKFIRFRNTIYSCKDLYTSIYNVVKKDNRIDITDLFKKIVRLFEKEPYIPLRLAIVDFEDILSICFGELGFDTEEFLSNLKYFIEIIDNNIGIRLYMYLKNKYFDKYYEKSEINKLYTDVFDILKKWYNKEIKIINKMKLEEMFIENLITLNDIEKNEQVRMIGNLYVIPKNVLRVFVKNSKEQVIQKM